jgi:hypothetical protein
LMQQKKLNIKLVNPLMPEKFACAVILVKLIMADMN